MSFEEVKALRKSDPEAAYQLAKDDLAMDPFDTQLKLSLGWVLFDRIKSMTSPEQIENFENLLSEISQLGLGEDGVMLNNQLTWLIGKLVFEFTKNPDFDPRGLEKVLNLTKTFYFTRPAKSYSFLFKAFHKAFKDNDDYIGFAEWWGLENFINDDFKRVAKGDGIQNLSAAEQAHITYSEHLLRIAETYHPEELEAHREKILKYLFHVSGVIRKNLQFEELRNRVSKLLSLLNQGDDLLENISPFVKKRHKDFWVWSAVAELYENDREKRLAFLCKAVLCKVREHRLLKTRIRLVEALIQTGYLPEAKTEIERIYSICRDFGLETPDIIERWTNEDWFIDISSGGNTMSLYKKFSARADEMVFGNIPEETIVVDFVNEDKKVLSFIKPDREQGFFNYSRFLKRVRVGDVFRVRIEETRQEGRYNVFTIQKGDDEYVDGLLQPFEGPVTNPMDKSFGFVEGMFIPPDLYVINNLRHGDFISGKAMIAYNKKKQEWGWKVIALIKNW